MSAQEKPNSQSPSSDDIPLGFGGIEASIGDHIAHFLESDDQRFSVLGPYIETGLRRGDCCVFLSHPENGDLLSQWLEDRGVDVADATSEGQLVLHSGRESEEGMRRLVQEIQEKKANDTSLVRWSGDGTWAFNRDTTVCEMLRWEAFLDERASDSRLLALCQYKLPDLGRDIIMDALRTHPYCVMGEVVVPNPLHESPETVRRELVTEE